jgi:hypothetical protein
VNSVIYKAILGKNPRIFWGQSVAGLPLVLFDSVFSSCILLVERSMFILWNGKILRKSGVLYL